MSHNAPLPPPDAAPFDLHALARRAMEDAGFEAAVPEEADAEAAAAALPDVAASGVRDLRGLLWSSVDNEESRDLDQVEYAEALPGGDIRLLVGIADVSAYAPPGSAIERHAARNTTTVYAGIEIFPMLPERLSTDLTSLLEGVDRLAMVTDLVVEPDGSVSSCDIYPAWVHNHARLAYETLGPWLEGWGEAPAVVGRVPGLAEQLRLQNEATDRFRALRHRNGALDFETIEASPVIDDGKVVDLAVTPKSRARYLIENFMVAVNSATALYLESRGIPAIQRVVRTPKRWPRIVEIAAALGEELPAAPDPRALAAFLAKRKAADPAHFPDLSLSLVKLLGSGEYTLVRAGVAGEGHFGLAVQGYTHATAPNRRYADLITQRLLKAAVAGAPPPYTEADLEQVAAHCTQRAGAAAKVERTVRKAAAALLLGRRIGDTFDAVVTGVKSTATYVRLLSPPAEGRVVRGEAGMDVGDHVRVRLVATDPESGFIDFEGT